ncbi:hypothetical protein E9531_15060 [Lampropedia puyangensis]|uniref:Phage coat protein n=1 Tax=Lampropedia puyangensis TaxID=1330072 RepID=A0A4S8EUE9_9BURK|nr:major capsid protein [Lampropedia puyangensis]THT98116.1 hypothetical protein E9531_15060 [Lampropedia puyangensis]
MFAQKVRGFAASAKAKVLAVAAIATAAASSAQAALPPEVSTAVTEYKDDAISAIVMVIAAGVAIWGLRKLGTKMGWF